MQYTIRQIPKAVDKVFRAKAKREKKSLNQIVVEALVRSAGVNSNFEAPKRDLSFLVGSMDEQTLNAIDDVRAMSERIWREDWK